MAVAPRKTIKSEVGSIVLIVPVPVKVVVLVVLLTPVEPEVVVVVVDSWAEAVLNATLPTTAANNVLSNLVCFIVCPLLWLNGCLPSLYPTICGGVLFMPLP